MKPIQSSKQSWTSCINASDKLSYAQTRIRKLLYKELEIVLLGAESLLEEHTNDKETIAAQDAAMDLVFEIMEERRRRGGAIEFTEEEAQLWVFSLSLLAAFEKMQRDLEIRDYWSTGLEGSDTFQIWEM